MIFIPYEGNKQSLLRLNDCVQALESTLTNLWSTDSMVRSRGYNVNERAFLRKLEQSTPAKRLDQIKWQNQRRIDYAVISLRFQWMVDQAAQAIAPVRQAASEVHAEVMQDEEARNVITADHDIAWNNYSYALALAACVTDLVNRYRANFAGDELIGTCLKALADNYKKLPRITLSHMVGMYLKNEDEVPAVGAFFSTCHIAPLTVANPEFERVIELVAQCRATHEETAKLVHALVTEVKGTLNEKNYQAQLAEAASEPQRFDRLRRDQQVHRSNYESVRIACRLLNTKLEALLKELCEAFEVVRNQPLPEAQVDRDRLYAAGFVVYWLVAELFKWKREQEMTIWEDPTKGAGKLDVLYAAAMTDAASLAEVDLFTRRGWYSDVWRRGHAFAFLQNFGTDEIAPLKQEAKSLE